MLTKEVLLFPLNSLETLTAAQLLPFIGKQLPCVSASTSALILLRDFIFGHVGIAAVESESGEQIGFVTMRDLLAEISNKTAELEAIPSPTSDCHLWKRMWRKMVVDDRTTIFRTKRTRLTSHEVDTMANYLATIMPTARRDVLIEWLRGCRILHLDPRERFQEKTLAVIVHVRGVN